MWQLAVFLAPKLFILWSLFKTDYKTTTTTKIAARFLFRRRWGRLKGKFRLAFHIPHGFCSVVK